MSVQNITDLVQSFAILILGVSLAGVTVTTTRWLKRIERDR